MVRTYDVIVIGGGFYGLRIAQFLYDELKFKRVLVIEKQKLMQRASYNNQARVHGGYHYPRSILTALRSRVNLPIFSAEYEDAIAHEFTSYYGVAKKFSKVTAQQYQRFFNKINAPISVSEEGMGYFDPGLVEQVFLADEYVFDAKKLKNRVMKNINSRSGIAINTGEKVESIRKAKNGLIELVTDKNTYSSKRVINSTYSSINQINSASGLEIIPLKHELTELCLVDVPDSFKGKAFTLMCGSFFSLMPFPPENCYSLSHVRYTPHSEWHDESGKTPRDSHGYLDGLKPKTNFRQMQADVKRYMPGGKDITYRGKSLWEVKTVLPQSESDDSRPILLKKHHGGIKNYICIMGGKIDNIYDVLRELKLVYG